MTQLYANNSLTVGTSKIIVQIASGKAIGRTQGNIQLANNAPGAGTLNITISSQREIVRDTIAPGQYYYRNGVFIDHIEVTGTISGPIALDVSYPEILPPASIQVNAANVQDTNPPAVGNTSLNIFLSYAAIDPANGPVISPIPPPSGILIYGWFVTNPNDTWSYLNIWEGGKQPVIIIGIPPQSAGNVLGAIPISLNGSAYITETTVPAGSTAPTNPMIVNLFGTGFDTILHP